VAVVDFLVAKYSLHDEPVVVGYVFLGEAKVKTESLSIDQIANLLVLYIGSQVSLFLGRWTQGQ